MPTFKEIKHTWQRIIWAAFSSLCFFFLAHGYRMSNNLYSHDSLLEVVQDDSAWQISLGRFMHPILIFLRGGLCNPWLIGCLSFIWLVLSVFLITEMFSIRKPVSVCIIAGTVICCPTVICANASFLQVADFYSLALLLSIIGVFFCRKKGLLWKVFGIILMTLSMGIYQAYICVSITMFIMCVIFAQADADSEDVVSVNAVSEDAGNNNSSLFRAHLFEGLKYCGCLLISAVLYFAIWKIFQRIFGIWTSDGYNGLATLENNDGQNPFALLAGTYKAVFNYFINPDVFFTMMFRGSSLSIVWVWLLRIVNLLLLLTFLWNLFFIKKAEKTSIPVMILDAVLVCLLPFGMNFVYFLSKGMEHTLMIFAFQLFYVIVVICSEKRPQTIKLQEGKPAERKLQKTGKNKSNSAAIMHMAIAALIAAIIWCNVVYANQVYLKKSLQEESAASLLTRIMTEVEQTEGYIPGTTPVAFSGKFSDSPYLRDIPGFEEVEIYGMGNTVLTYMGTDYAFLRYELNIPINEVRVSADDPAVSQMPVYPEKGSISYVNGVLVVKISE